VTESAVHSRCRLRVVTRLAVTALLLAVAAAWLASALLAIANFAFRYPAFDQFRLYVAYLALEFPASALQTDNGHRMLLPALVRIAELHWFAGNQRLQVAVGAGLALLTCAVVAHAAWRGRASAIAGAAGVLMAVLGVFWLGNARDLMHGNELLNIYVVTACTVLALLAVRAAARSRPLLWTAVAGVLAMLATFSFGSGIAAFAAVLVAAFVLRLPARGFAAPVALLLFALVAYLATPGQGGLGAAPALRPLENAGVLLRWLASPWFHGWLGFADPAMLAWGPGDTAIERVLDGSAKAIATLLGGNWKFHAGLAIGGAGLVGYALAVVSARRRASPPPWLEVLALGVAGLGLGVGAIIAIARLGYFDQFPGQVMADRYLPWPCLFWLGLGLYGLARADASARGSVRVFAPALALLVAIGLYPSHAALAGWSAAVHRIVQQTAVAAQLGIWDPERFPQAADASRTDIDASLALMRERRLAMFADPDYTLFAAGWRAPADPLPAAAAADAHVVRVFHDDAGDREVVAFEGWLAPDVAHPADALLVVVDDGGGVRGLAKFAFVTDSGALRLRPLRKRGFDGYVLAPRAGESLHVLVLDPATRAVLAQVPLAIP
jgi:hypothetical protein